ncbi:hypothetical protein TIFTF001_030513 [Ficus carica]|uniref:Retroviral polymerase SH3-like domain-containing protein n=1 Tax=Ficus carica TaxID=3494 RepID=A0AA88DXQ0_FICCA|nr:hypothetical protein TIFTF001_030513 [Ficus carica]
MPRTSSQRCSYRANCCLQSLKDFNEVAKCYMMGGLLEEEEQEIDQESFVPPKTKENKKNGKQKVAKNEYYFCGKTGYFNEDYWYYLAKKGQGYPKGTKGYLCYNAKEQRTFVSMHVKFLEKDFVRDFKLRSKVMLEEMSQDMVSPKVPEKQSKPIRINDVTIEQQQPREDCQAT